MQKIQAERIIARSSAGRLARTVASICSKRASSSTSPERTPVLGSTGGSVGSGERKTPEGSSRSVVFRSAMAFGDREWLGEVGGSAASSSMPVSLIGGANDLSEPAAGKRTSPDSGPGTTGRAIAIVHYTWTEVGSVASDK